LHHLRINPGKGIEYDKFATYDLFLLLQKRTAGQLLNANFDADRTIHTFNDKTIDVQASSLGRVQSGKFMALVFKEDNDRVHLFRSERNGTVQIKRAFSPLEVLNVGGVRIVKTVVYSGSDNDLLAVLVQGQDFDTDAETDANVAPAFAQLAQQQQLQGNYFLLSYLIGSDPLDDSDFKINVCRIYEHDNFKVNDLALDDFSTFAISWEDVTENGAHEVIVYTTWPEEYEDDILCVSSYTP
jgi:hypothetical protein